MDQEKLKALAKELAKDLKTEKDLNTLTQQLLKLTVETALNAELTDHLGYEKNASRTTNSNARNGHTSKRLKTTSGEIELQTSRARENSFEPLLVKKHQTRLTQMDDQILSLYAKGLSTREIVDTFKELYDTDVSPTLISRVTDSVMERVLIWQNRPLEAIYPIVYFDCIVVKVRQDNRVINKSIFLALGINVAGLKELLGLWIAENEGAKFWSNVMTELQNRGVKDILIACIDGLKGFPESITSVYPHTQIQLCIVHMIRNSLKYVAWKDYKAIATDLKTNYQASTEEMGQQALEQCAQQWDGHYPQISKAWRTHWHNLSTFYAYPDDIRKAIYTTNAIESLNSVLRHALGKRKLFPNDDAVRKVMYLAIDAAARKWTMPIRNWRLAMNRFIITFGDRLTQFI